MIDAASAPMKTSPPQIQRTISAILLATVFILTNVPAFYFLGRSCFDSFPMPSMYFAGSVRFQDELIGHCLSFDGLSSLMFKIDLHNRRIRFENPPLYLGENLLVSNDKKLWNVSRDAVIVTDGLTEKRYSPQRAWKSPISGVFLYQNCPAIVDMDDFGVKYHLYVLQDGEWQDRGEIGIPGAGRKWIKNELTGIDQMQPCLSCVQRLTPGSRCLEVIEVGGVCHLFFNDIERRLDPEDSRITAYRKGFDFSNNLNEASAMAPDNVPADTVGWGLLDLKFGLGVSAVDRDKIVLVRHQSPSHPIQFWEQSSNAAEHQFEVVAELKATNRWEDLDLINVPDGSGLYFIRYRPILPKFYHYHNRELQEIPPPWDTDLTRIVRWAEPIMVRLAAVFVIGILLLVVGAELLSRTLDDRYGFGLTNVRLAPIWRRCLARGIDLTLILGLAGFYAIQLGPYQIAAVVYDLWEAMQPGYAGKFDFHGIEPFFQTPNGNLAIQSSSWAAVVFFILIVAQSRWGVTPGKWLCRLRVVRTTLRPCGFARSLLREFLMIADAPLLLTILPAILAMVTTDHRQRIGDLFADTVVVDTGIL